MPTSRPSPTAPTSTGREKGLEWCRFDPQGTPKGAVLILHGAGSRKENHFDIAREFASRGLAAICFDQRGHGDSQGPMDSRIIDDAVSVARLFEGLPLGIRGSSMGGWVALAAAQDAGAKAVVAICPTTAAQLSVGIESGHLSFEVDRPSLLQRLATGDPPPPSVPTLLLHAAGDEVVPVERSRELSLMLNNPRSRYVETPGGHHRSLQHDPEFIRLTADFLEDELSASSPSA